MLTEVNGCRMYVKTAGPKRATAILAFHSPGGSVDSRYVADVFRPFTDAYRVVVFDLRGNGRSEGLGSPSFAQLTADAEAIRKKLGLGKVVVAGSSGAGYLALEYALRHPKSTQGLILWSTAPTHTGLRTLKAAARASGVAVDWGRFERYWSGECRDNLDLKEAIKEFNVINGVLSPNYHAARSPTRRFWRYSAHNFAMQEQCGGWDVEGQLKEISAPALIMHGDRDWIIPVAQARRLSAGIRNSRMRIFEGSGHWLHAEKKAEFEAEVRRFLRKFEDDKSVAHK